MSRVPGRYVVWVMAAVGVVFFAATLVVAVRLTPAADRFRQGTPPADPAR